MARYFQFRISVMILLVVASGCFSTNGAIWPLSPGQVDRFARTLEPSELMEKILLGEKACGGIEAQSILRAAYWLKRGDSANSLSQIAKVSPDGPHRTTSFWLAGEALYRAGNLTQSMRILTPLVAEQPDDLEAHRCLAALYFDISAMHQARDELKHIIRLAPKDFRPHHLLGRIDLDFQKYDSAVKHFRTALDLCKASGPLGELRRGMGASLRGDKRYDELLKWVPENDPDLTLQVCRADALWSTGQANEANRVLEFVLGKDPQLADALLLSSRIASDRGELESATKLLEQLLEQNPHDVTARYQLALVQRQAGKLDAFQETIKLKDQTQSLIDRMIELNEQIIENPGDPRRCLEIAEICEQLGKTALAESWRKAADGLIGAGSPVQPIR